MGALPATSRVRFRSHSYVPVSQRNLVNITGRRRINAVSAPAATIATNAGTITTRNPKQVLRPVRTVSDGLSLGPIGSVADPVLFTDQQTNDEALPFNRSNGASREGEGLREEVRIVMEKLERVGERVRGMELEKMRSRLGLGGDVYGEDSVMVEVMTKEIVNGFLEKPIQYLNCPDGDLEGRLKDLNIFVAILEESCFVNDKKSSH